MIEVRNVTQSIQGKEILHDITVTIQRGKLTSLIGPNGAGKSTLLSAISRIVKHDQGEIVIEGHAIKDFNHNDLAKKLSILKQSNHTDMNITVEQLVQFGRFPYCKGRLNKDDMEHVESAIKLLNLQHIRDRNIKALSGGQRQRAYIAMTIAQDTDYILLDEPLNNLDMKHSVQIMQTIKRLCRDFNKTIVIVLHDINFASCYSDYIIALKDGYVIKEGVKDQVIDSHILNRLYDMSVAIEEIRGQKICLYFNNDDLLSKI